MMTIFSCRNAVLRTMTILLLGSGLFAGVFAADPVDGWLSWRGPQQNGTSLETGLVDKIAVEDALWTYDLSSRGTPVIAGNRLYVFGYTGQGADLREVLTCLDTETGKKNWEYFFGDFLSDIIYDRYSIGAPVIDPPTGNVYVFSSAGIFAAFSATGKKLWEHSMGEELGRLTFPNGRTGAPVIDGDLVIVRGITANWGGDGPARDRFYAFDKANGDLIWSSTPGVAPKDNSFSTPVFANLGERRVFYCGTGCGNIICVDARTGEPLARFQLLAGGINSSVLLYKEDKVIAIHDLENLDSSDIGRMVAVKMGHLPEPGKVGPVELGKEAEVWRNALGMFSSSPVLVGNRVYQINNTGSLCAVNADTGEVLWKEKLSYTQLHASPVHADGKLYIPMKDGSFYVIRPSDEKAEILSKTQLEGEALGAPAIWNGKIFVTTIRKLYCFGKPGDNPNRPKPVAQKPANPVGKAVALRVVPAEVLLTPGASQTLRVQALDAAGRIVENYAIEKPVWEKYIPPTARVKATLNAAVSEAGVMTADTVNSPSAGMFKVSAGGLEGFIRGRILPAIPYSENFDEFELGPHSSEQDVNFAYPPLPWIGARFKWEVREVEGNKVLAKALDALLFQRAFTFMGTPDMKNYTMIADIMSDGNRRTMSSAGLINQHYIIYLDGNWQILEVTSNQDRIKVSVPFKWSAGVWYRLKTRVDLAADGSGVIRAKAWQRDQAEPEAWTIEVPHKTAHQNGSPGLFGFSPQNLKRVYIDNISVTPNP